MKEIRERFRGIGKILPYKLAELLEAMLAKYVVDCIVLVPTKYRFCQSQRKTVWKKN